MSRHLAQLLGVTEHAAELATAKLESLSGFASEDNRLVSELKMALRPKIAELGLDPDDTTPQELYHGLLARFEADSHVFGSLVGTLWHNNPDRFSARLISLVKLSDLPLDVWVLKRSVAKSILRAQPPKRLMRQLNYRSVDSLLKREDIDELYSALPKVESTAWLKVFFHHHAAAKASDFETRSVRFVTMPASNWTKFASRRVTNVPQLGIVALWPQTAHRQHAALEFINILDAVDELRSISFRLMTSQVRPDFPKVFARVVENPSEPITKIGHIPISWQTLSYHYGRLPHHSNPLSEPHFGKLSLHKIDSSRILAGLHPSFRWWANNDTLAALTGEVPVSANLADIAHNFTNRHDYHQRQAKHLSRLLWNELISRYMTHPGVENFVLNHLDRPALEFETKIINSGKNRLQPEAILA